MLRYEVVKKDNLDIVVKVQNEIFPHENGKKNFVDSTNKVEYRKELKFWIVFNNDLPIGVVGIYVYHEYPEDAWLGWFGVLEAYRNKGYGSQIFDFFENYAREKEYKHIRLYTDEEENKEATKFYTNKGMISEEYVNKEDIFYATSKTLIFSKSLTNKPTEKWNNKFLNLAEQEKRQEESNNIF